MKKYMNDYIQKFFSESNLNCYKLGKILDITENHVRRYLLGDGRINTEESLLIDAAILVTEKRHLRQPEWNIGEWRWGRLRYGDTYESALKVFNEELRKLSEEQKRKTEDDAINVIVWILDDKEGHNEFLLNRDPLFYCGLESYGLGAFKRRAKRLINEIV